MPIYKDISVQTYKEVKESATERKHQIRLFVTEEEFAELQRHSRESRCAISSIAYSVVKRWIDENRESVPEKN